MQLNLESGLTKEDVRKLIASKDDSESRQLRVTTDGIAYLSGVVGNRGLDGNLFRLEIWDSGNDYVGHQASMDDVWVTRIYNAPRRNWPNPYSTYIDDL
ncbi:hypothetical protein [Halomonas maura]|uniref:hypothetical protein n=1 Tax=Halomonas maura TaxID=117606 RepID=UPI0025B39946|nr:hypothetical protein [Halomonas maura]MDN3554392.1 hypothetical protein [Halomonas maura]